MTGPRVTPVGSRLGALRVAARLTHLQVATALGVSRRRYGQIEADDDVPPRHVATLARLLGVSRDSLVDRLYGSSDECGNGGVELTHGAGAA